MNSRSVSQPAARWPVVLCLCLAFSSLSCVFLYVGGPEKDRSPSTPRRDFVDSTILGIWRWVPSDQSAGESDYYYILLPQGEMYATSDGAEDSTAATYHVSLERSLCHPGELAYRMIVDGGIKFEYELTEITQDTIRMADCSGVDSEPFELIFVRTSFDDDNAAPSESPDPDE